MAMSEGQNDASTTTTTTLTAISLVPSVSAVVIAVAFPDLHDAFSSPSTASALVLIRFTLVIFFTF